MCEKSAFDTLKKRREYNKTFEILTEKAKEDGFEFDGSKFVYNEQKIYVMEYLIFSDVNSISSENNAIISKDIFKINADEFEKIISFFPNELRLDKISYENKKYIIELFTKYAEYHIDNSDMYGFKDYSQKIDSIYGSIILNKNNLNNSLLNFVGKIVFYPTTISIYNNIKTKSFDKSFGFFV